MARNIKLSDAQIAASQEKLAERLKSGRFFDGEKISISVDDLPTVDATATVIYRDLAYAKTMMLIQSYDSEVAWYGMARRCEQENTYEIYDIMVYPQTVNGTYVDTDEQRFATWLQEISDDPRSDCIRMQGHSHVNMSTSPSGTDLDSQKKSLNILKEDGFYIFFIMNKKLEYHGFVYDMKTNLYFGPDDVEMVLDDVGDKMVGILEEASEQVKAHTARKFSYTNQPAEKTKVLPKEVDPYGWYRGYDYGSYGDYDDFGNFGGR